MLSNKMQEVSHDWLRLVEAALTKMEQLPPLEESFPFPWGDAAQAIQSALELPHLSLSPERVVWKGAHELLNGLGENPAVVSLELSPIEGHLFFAMSQNDVAYLTASGVSEQREGFANRRLQDGFYQFLFLKALQAVEQLKVFKDVSFHFSPKVTIPQESGFCIDIQCELGEKTIRGRVVCPQSFLAAFKAHQPMQKHTLLTSEATAHIEVTLRTEVGNTQISQEEWGSINVGDFLVLERCAYNPVDEKGSMMLVLGDTPLIIGRMKHEGLKVVDYALYQEEPISTENQFVVTAEIGRIRMPLQKLLHLEPGTILEMLQRPEQGVDVTIGGKKVAKGELLKLGEIVGIRILDLSADEKAPIP